jgi:hypothetical protein
MKHSGAEIFKTKWIPGKINSKPVRTSYKLPNYLSFNNKAEEVLLYYWIKAILKSKKNRPNNTLSEDRSSFSN